MQDTSCSHPFSAVSSKFPFIFTIFIISQHTMLWTGFQRPTWSCISFRCRVSSTVPLPQGPIIQLTFPQGKCRRRPASRPPNDDRQTHYPRYLLPQMRHYPWLEIRKFPLSIYPASDSYRTCRRRRTNSRRSTKKANISLSVPSSWMFSRGAITYICSHSELAILYIWFLHD